MRFNEAWGQPNYHPQWSIFPNILFGAFKYEKMARQSQTIQIVSIQQQYFYFLIPLPIIFFISLNQTTQI